MEVDQLTHKIIGCAYTVHNQLGFGFLESVYKNAMLIELGKAGLHTEAEKHLQVYYDGQVVGDYYADLFVEEEILLELKSVQSLSKEHEAQLVNYLNAVHRETGVLINFGPHRVEVRRKYREFTPNAKKREP